MAGGDHGNERHEAALRRDRVLELRDQGLTFKEIGAELGVTTERAWQIHKRALRERPALAAAALRDEERKQAQLAVIDEQRRDVDMEREAVMGNCFRTDKLIMKLATRLGWKPKKGK